MHTEFAVTTCFRHARLAAARLAIPVALLVGMFAPFQTSFAVPIYIALTAGTDHTCALLNNGSVQCWGSNSDGQLGNDNLGTDSNLPVNVEGITNAIGIGSGGKTTCARLADNTFRCWGDSLSGQLGNGSSVDSGVPVQVSDITAGTLITGGSSHMCARIIGGTVSCWGGNGFGQLGIGFTGGTFDSPQPVPSLSGVTTLGLGGFHSCARLSDSTLRCWGANSGGQLGDNSTDNKSVPTPVDLITTASSVEAGGNHTCARLSDSSVACWGNNFNGQLGDGTGTSRLQPVAVPGISTATSLALGNNFSCARLSTGTVQCWGQGNRGQMGNGATNNINLSPVAVSGLTAVSQIAVGGSHACALVNTGRIVCWGFNASGQLGNGTNTNASTPRAVRDGRCTLDIDGDGVVGATTDMLMLTRASLGMGGAAVTQSALGSNPLRGDWTAIRSYLVSDCGMTNLAP